MLLNYSAYSPQKWKLSLIFCLLHRAYSICSSFVNFHLEIDKLRNMFSANGYPLYIFDSILRKFLERCLQGNHSKPTDQDNDTFTLVLPYFGQLSKILQSRIHSLCTRYHKKCRVVFRPFKVSSYFTLKSRCPKELQALVVYKYVCSVDQNTTYIGKTKRHLALRVKEHLSTTSANSAVFQHVATCNCAASIQNFSVLRCCQSDYDLSIMEALYIRDNKPSLNIAIAGQGSSIFLKL